MERKGLAGHVLNILDEKNKPVPGASVILGGHHYQPDKYNGIVTIQIFEWPLDIIIPYTTQPRMQKIIIVEGACASLQEFRHEAETYELSCGFYLDKEDVVKGKK